MNAFPELACPHCLRTLERLDPGTDGERRELSCPRCERLFGEHWGCLDLRLKTAVEAAPYPLLAGDSDQLAAVCAAQGPYRAALEALLLELPDERGERLMQLLREGRGAWFPLLRSAGGQALFIGNALSGSVPSLATSGFLVTVLDLEPERCRFSAMRCAQQAPGRTRHLIGGDGPHLPFPESSFELVVQEGGLPEEQGFAHDLAEARRVCNGELFLSADNRLGYKRSSGRRADFRVPGPFEYLSDVLRPERPLHSLRGYKKRLAGRGFAGSRAFALYPHSLDFTHVVAIDEALPKLAMGPKERKNKLKIVGRALGLFPLLTPSFGIVTTRVETLRESLRIERILETLGERLQEPGASVEHLHATRDNSSLINTCIPGSPEEDPRGRWSVHIPLNASDRRQLERRHYFLELLRERFPGVPVPRALFMGTVDGVWLACERRLCGLPAPQLTGRRDCATNMLEDVVAHFSSLVVEAAKPMSEEVFSDLVSSKFELVSRFAHVPSTLKNLERLHTEMREILIGRPVPRVLYHADLRGKHLHVRPDGHVVGYLDWGSSQESDLPYYDLLQLLVHERKQEGDLGAQRAWEIVRERDELRDYERQSLEQYALRTGLDEETCRAFERMYPVFVADTAENNWDYSRPRWIHRHFGL